LPWAQREAPSRNARKDQSGFNASSAELARKIEARTISISEFAYYTSISALEVREEIEHGALRTRMVGKRRRILITPEARSRVLAGMARLKELGMGENIGT
jgi:hypothetical protein